jgi:zinc transport system substrate-binding protein
MLIAAPSEAAGRAKVAASIFPLADLVRKVGGDRVEVITLLPSGASEHTFEPTTAQMRMIADINLYVKVGAGMDVWADRLILGARKQPLVLEATSGIPLISVSMEEITQQSKHHDHEGDDPHVWLDPLLMRDYLLPQVERTLSQLQPSDAAYFKENRTRFARELTQLYDEMNSTIRTFRTREFIAMHSAWGYLAKRFALHQVAAVEPFPGKEPSARYIAALVSKARKNGVTTIFAEPQISPKSAQVLASELGGKVLVLDPLGGEKIPGRDSYIGLMRYNLSILAGGMR